MARQIYREEPLKYLSTPDRLDESLRLVSNTAWLAVASGFIGCTALVLWGFFGSINVSVTGLGLLAPPDGVPAVASTVSGIVEEIYVKKGQKVNRGDHIATITQPVLNVHYEATLRDLLNLKNFHQTQTQVETANLDLILETFRRQKMMLDETVTLLQQQEMILKRQLNSSEELYNKGIISEDEFDRSKIDLMLVQQNIASSISQSESIDKQIDNTLTQHHSNIEQRELNIKNKQSEADALAARIKKEGELYAVVSGTVSEISVQVGQNVAVNQSIVLIEDAGHAGNFEAVVFVSAIQAKRILPEQSVLIAPTITRPSEHGQITGNVLSVSRFPVTETRLLTLFNNETLARQFLNAGSVFEVRVALDRDSDTPSGFRWTGGRGPNIEVTSGNLCNVTFSVEKRRPASYLIPFLRRNLFGTDDTGVY